MLLFRRKGREKETPAEDRPAEPSRPPSVPLRPPAASATPSQSPAPAVAPPRAPPPPLPRRAPGADAGPATSARFPRCFVCGSTLEEGRCPVCGLAWVE